MAEAIADLERRLLGLGKEAFLSDRDEQALTAFRLAVLAENASKLSAGLKARHPSIPWKAMAGFRNLVAHAYHIVDPHRAWDALEDLPALAAMIRAECNRPD